MTPIAPANTTSREAAAPVPALELAPPRNAYSALSSDEFLKIIMTELSNQDPLQPNDSKALLEQLSSIRNIQSSVDLQDQLKSLITQNELASASGLIGRNVTGLTGSNDLAEGRVVSVARSPEGAMLTLDSGQTLPMSRLDRVLALPAAATGAAQ